MGDSDRYRNVGAGRPLPPPVAGGHPSSNMSTHQDQGVPQYYQGHPHNQPQGYMPQQNMPPTDTHYGYAPPPGVSSQSGYFGASATGGSGSGPPGGPGMYQPQHQSPPNMINPSYPSSYASSL
ncbi:hypothetical protein BC829DRAFT_190826 [Chytridium lagenaria]|nr:hypothetical protein BC829DRAFT_190826 [Chytridium lagenaria]